MGKRELLIIAGFFLVGGIVYQFTAPPATDGGSGFSLSNLFNEARREMRGNPGRASVTHTATIPVPATTRELRVLRVSRDIRIVGEKRDTIEYALTVSSNGPDDASAKSYADKSVFVRDDAADSLVLRVTYPEEGSQDSSAVLKVPARLAVRVESSNGVTVEGVGAVHVEAARGPVSLTNIAGAVTGIHQDGAVSVNGAESVKLRVTRLRSNFEKIRGGLVLDVRDGECTVKDSSGDVEVDSLRAEVTIVGQRGKVTTRGTEGRVAIESPTAETRVDMRRTEVEVSHAGSAPVFVSTTDELVRIIVRDGAAFALDALTVGGNIQGGDLQLVPERTDTEQKLKHTFGRGGATVTVRNTRGDIVIRK